ncbi:MAG: alkanesulfonate monooxygenase [Solirubrobacteraceae bacterium]|jgi:alkanesulfonate monooxygenase|nr:alkanesulfonate monooxygenase [Solirubrobacteraceae bacterium]
MAPVHLHWFLPTAGDSRDVSGFGPAKGRRPPEIEYLSQVAKAADHLGFEGVLTPTGTGCEDSWLTTAALTRDTERLKFLVAFRPGFISPTLAAQQAGTFQRISGGRLLLNIVTGGDADEQRRFGDWLDHDSRYERTAEFLTVLRGAWEEKPFDFEGAHYKVEGATTRKAPSPIPDIFFGGASDAAEVVAAEHCDVYLTWGEPPSLVAERLDRMRSRAATAGRELRFGIRLHVISRDRAEDAWAVTERMLDAMPDNVIQLAQRNFAATESVGQQRMAALHGGSRASLLVAPNLWAGFGLVRGGAGTALVGSHDEVAERIAEYHGLGFDHFILSGQPHLEEAYWFGEGVMPVLRAAGLLSC